MHAAHLVVPNLYVWSPPKAITLAQADLISSACNPSLSVAQTPNALPARYVASPWSPSRALSRLAQTLMAVRPASSSVQPGSFPAPAFGVVEQRCRRAGNSHPLSPKGNYHPLLPHLPHCLPVAHMPPPSLLVTLLAVTVRDYFYRFTLVSNQEQRSRLSYSNSKVTVSSDTLTTQI